MKKLSLILVLVLVLVLEAPSMTAFYYSSRNSDNSPNVQQVVMQAWPPVFTWTIVGTNLVYGGLLITNQPDVTGFFTNNVSPGSYRLFFPGLNSYVYANIPDTAVYNSLALYITNAPNTQNLLSQYGIITNMLGFAPATNSKAGVISAFQATPATNTPAGIISAFQATPATNTPIGILSALQYTPLTNSTMAIDAMKPGIPTNIAAIDILKPGIITNLAGVDAVKPGLATNYTQTVANLGYQPATNTFFSITNLIVSGGGVPAMLGYIPATNTSMGLIATLGFMPPNITNVAGLLNAGPGLSIVTNGNQYGYSLWIYTNLATGVLPTITAPNGSTLDASNGASYHMTNNVWHLIQTF